MDDVAALNTGGCHGNMERMEVLCEILDGNGWRETPHIYHHVQTPIEGCLVDLFERRTRDM